MPIREDQRLRRRGWLGSSDSPAILGLDLKRNAGDVYVEKTSEMIESPSTDPQEIGNDFELPLLSWAARELGVEIRPNVELVPRPDLPAPMGANLDALVIGKREGLEAKTGTGTDYGDPGTDQVPERVLIQCHHQMVVAELDLVWVPVLIARFDRLERVMYKVSRNEDLCKLVVERDASFWHDHVLPRRPPEALLPSMDTLRRVRRIPEVLASVDPELVARWKLVRAERLALEKQEEAAKAALVAALGDAEGAEWGDPKKILTFKGYQYDQIDGKEAAKDPAVWAKYRRTITVSPSLKEVNRK